MKVVARLLAAALVMSASGSGWGQRAVLPELHGTTLSGETVDLPQALKGRTSVLVLGFSQSSRGQVTAWGKRLSGDFRDSNQVLYYEMPVLAAVPRLLRGMVVKKISSDVPERAKARFLPVYEHEAELRQVAGYSKADDAYVLVLDTSGTVVWKGEGEASDALYGEVKRRVAELAK